MVHFNVSNYLCTRAHNVHIHKPSWSSTRYGTARHGAAISTHCYPAVPSPAVFATRTYFTRVAFNQELPTRLRLGSDPGSDSHHRVSFVHASKYLTGRSTYYCCWCWCWCWSRCNCPALQCTASLLKGTSYTAPFAHSQVLMRLQDPHWHPSSPSVPLLQTQIRNSISLSLAVSCDLSYLRGPISTTSPPLRVPGGSARLIQPRKLHLHSGPLIVFRPRIDPAFQPACSPPGAVAGVSSRERQH